MQHAIDHLTNHISYLERQIKNNSTGIFDKIPMDAKERGKIMAEITDLKYALSLVTVHSKVKPGDPEDPKFRIQRIAQYFTKKLPMPSAWSNDIVDYILNRSHKPE